MLMLLKANDIRIMRIEQQYTGSCLCGARLL